MIVDCISDLHGFYPELEGGDLLIVAGDLTRSDAFPEYLEFFTWLLPQKYTRKILIAGNHDNMLKSLYRIPNEATDLTYLCDSGIEFKYEALVIDPKDPTIFPKLITVTKKLKIWGSPWTKAFPGMNPKCKAFTFDTDEELAEKWALIPDDVDILVTHCPLFTCFDSCKDPADGKTYNVGSPSLNGALARINPSLHVFGHIHENGGRQGIYKPKTVIVNASHVNESYEPVNKPIRVIL